MDKGRGLSDIRHYAVIEGNWELPLGSGKPFLTSGIASKLLGGWSTNAIVSMRGGFPISVYVQGDVCNCAAYSKRALDVGDAYSGFTRSRLQWFNTAAFVQPVSGRFGNSGHNTLSGPRGKTVSFPVFGVPQVSEQKHPLSHNYPVFQ